MKLSISDTACGHIIQSYKNHEIVIDGRRYKQSLILLPNRMITGWSVASFDELSTADFEQLAELKADVMLLGTGASQRFPSATQLAPLITNGTGFEVMNTPSACRTYNLLQEDGRAVAAALILD